METHFVIKSRNEGENKELWQKLYELSRIDPGIHTIMQVGHKNGFTKEQILLEISIHQTQQLIETNKKMIDFAKNNVKKQYVIV